MAQSVQAPCRLEAAAGLELARTLWELGELAVLGELPSERDQNFLLAGGSERFVLKIARAQDDALLLDAQNEAMLRVAARTVRFRVPVPLASATGRLIEETTDADGAQRLVRILRYLPGSPLAEADKDGLASEFGAVLGELSRVLAGFHHAGAVRDLYWDVRRSLDVVGEHAHEIADPERRAFVVRLAAQLEPAFATIPQLRLGVVHNDANDYNVLVEDGRVTGLLDFGDLLETVTVAEPAVGMAYAMLQAREPLAVARRFAAAFHERFALEPQEAAALLPLALARLCASVTLAAHQRSLAPDNEYLSISERDAWSLLEHVDGLELSGAQERVAAACAPPRPGRRSSQELLEARGRLIGPSLSLSYLRPLHIVRGAGAYLYDADGRAYLDCVNNVCHVGHAHPRVVDAAAAQMAALNTNTRYLHEHLLAYAERLVATLPEPLAVCYFVCSGSEANELALRLARAHTQRHDVVVLDEAYHGNTSTLVELSPYKFDGPGGAGRQPYVHVAPLPDPFRGPYRGDDAGRRYADAAGAALAEAPAAALFAESLPGCGGQIVPPPGFLHGAFELARAAGAVVVADEVQVGLGRVGSRFWGFELDGAVPDVVTLGKPLGNGHPLGAVVTTRAIADSFANGMEYFNTFGGNPVSSAVGLAVLDVIQDERLQQQAAGVGAHLLAGLRTLADRHELIGDVRGAGLYIGVELVASRDTLEPATAETARIVERAREDGVLLSTDGPFRNVIKIKPPLVFSRADADLLVATLDAAF
ncbi:MAG TPA: aminotransferase class III-fold pyridoxal phosphate-dependent enzyme [Gaiellaceae bacterium]